MTVAQLLSDFGIVLDGEAVASISDAHLVTIAPTGETLQEGLVNDYLLTAIDYFEDGAVLTLIGEKNINIILLNPEPETEPAAEETDNGEEAAQEPEEDLAALSDEELLEKILPENASLSFDVAWDGEPALGSTAHFIARMEGYDNLNYTLQWQYSLDNETWLDLEGETGSQMDLVITEENCAYYWRITVIISVEMDS